MIALTAALTTFAVACESIDEDDPSLRAGPEQAIAEPLPGRPVPPLATPPEPVDLMDYVQDREAAIELGKALFWDMQVGDDKQACASCHFNAGADSRSKNQISPGLLVRDPDQSYEPSPDHEFDLGPNRQLLASDYPFRKLADPLDRTSPIVADTNDVTASQGVYHAIFGEQPPHDLDPNGFHVGDTNVRRVEPRNTPTVFNAVYNHRNFWDGRAQNSFNGVNPFGERDPLARVYRRSGKGGALVPVKVDLENSSLASQAVGPPTNSFEMSAAGREFPDVARSLAMRSRRLGKRLDRIRPLGLQKVHPNDSVLGSQSRWPTAGLKAPTYQHMIQKAFRKEWWSSPHLIRVAKDGTTSVVHPKYAKKAGDELFTLTEYNFSLFFGIAVQMYEATLISDESPFDEFLRGDDNALTAEAKRGLDLFFSPPPAGAGCLFCHDGPELTVASIREVEATGLTQIFTVPFFVPQSRETGYFNIGVRETYQDLGLGGTDPFGNPLAAAASLPLPTIGSQQAVLAVDGAFKAPGLRNVALTAPYFHNGGQLTLRDVVDFYVRGGDVHPTRLTNRTGGPLLPLPTLGHLTEADKQALVAFLEALTDERVLQRVAPFDHPQLFVANGSQGNEQAVANDGNGKGLDEMIEIPAVGKFGGTPLASFLDSLP